MFDLSVGEILKLIGLLFYLKCIGLMALPAWTKFYHFKPSQWGLVRLFSILFAIYITWVSQLLFKGKGIIISIVICIIVVFIHRRTLKPILKKARNEIFLIEVLFLSVFLIFAVFRAISLDIVTGEKPMDISFLNYFIRIGEASIVDPWLSGEPLTYYYLGYLHFGKALKFFNISGAIGYNYILAILAGLFAIGIYSFVKDYCKSKFIALLAAAGLLFGTNLKSVILFLGPLNKLNFSYFWQVSRQFIDTNGIRYFSEHPHWSFVFGDLHAHVISYPFFILALYIIAQFVLNKCRTRNFSQLVLVSFILGMFIGLNIWDFCVLWGCLAIGLLIFNRSREIISFFPGLLLPFILHFPFLLLLQGDRILAIHLVKTGFNEFYHTLNQIGLWLLPMFIFLIINNRWLLPKNKAGKFLIILSGCQLGLFSINAIMANQYSLILTGILLASCLILLAIRIEKKASVLELIFLTALAFIIFAEQFILIDRYNTLFKFYNAIYILLGVGFFFCLNHIYELSTTKLRYRYFFAGMCFVLTFHMSLSFINLYALKQKVFLFGKSSNTIDAQRILRLKNKQEAIVIEWMNRHIIGTPTMVEAVGPSFSEFGRFTHFTGIPSFLAWPSHLKVRGKDHFLIQKRRNIVNQIYSTTDVYQSYSLMQENEIDLLVVGKFEKLKYPRSGWQKFNHYPQLFVLLYENNNIAIYRRADAKVVLKGS